MGKFGAKTHEAAGKTSENLSSVPSTKLGTPIGLSSFKELLAKTTKQEQQAIDLLKELQAYRPFQELMLENCEAEQQGTALEPTTVREHLNQIYNLAKIDGQSSALLKGLQGLLATEHLGQPWLSEGYLTILAMEQVIDAAGLNPRGHYDAMHAQIAATKLEPEKQQQAHIELQRTQDNRHQWRCLLIEKFRKVGRAAAAVKRLQAAQDEVLGKIAGIEDRITELKQTSDSAETY